MREDSPYQDIIREYSLGELYGVQKRLDRDAYPDRYELILNEIEKRKASHKPNTHKRIGNKQVSVKVHYKESIGNVFVLTALASAMFKEWHLNQWPLLTFGTSIFLFIIGIYYRTATYILIRNNLLVVRRLIWNRSSYDLTELDLIYLEGNKLFLIMRGDKVDAEIRRRDANPKEWQAFMKQLSQFGLVK